MVCSCLDLKCCILSMSDCLQKLTELVRLVRINTQTTTVQTSLHKIVIVHSIQVIFKESTCYSYNGMYFGFTRKWLLCQALLIASGSGADIMFSALLYFHPYYFEDILNFHMFYNIVHAKMAIYFEKSLECQDINFKSGDI